MRDVARDPAALEPLEPLRVQRSRLADRMRPPWWYLTGVAILYALVFAVPFTSRFLGVSIWPIFVAAAAVACLLQWGMTRATGIMAGFRNLRYPPRAVP
jgi:predicted lysophospholipase L1 biosynthesis ABC-type transport system permease subunit